MSTPDEHRSRRAITALSHGKPRPYRRQVYSDEPFRLSRVQLVLLGAGAVVIAGLILTVTVIAQEHANATRGKAIIAADASPGMARPEHGLADAGVVAVGEPPLPALPTPPALDDSSLPFPLPSTPPPPARSGQARAAMPARLTMPGAIVTRSARQPPAAARPVPRPAPRPAAPDPDVDLIATILQLTPPPLPLDRLNAVCTPAEVLENLCGEHHGMRP